MLTKLTVVIYIYHIILLYPLSEHDITTSMKTGNIKETKYDERNQKENFIVCILA